MELDIARTTFRAPFDGTIEAGHVEQANYVKIGEVTAMIVDLDPILVVGNISERQVGTVKEGMTGHRDPDRWQRTYRHRAFRVIGGRALNAHTTGLNWKWQIRICASGTA